MAWVNIPNEVVMNFTGRPLRVNKLDANLEPVYNTIACPNHGCDYPGTQSVTEMQEHLAGEHAQTPQEANLVATLELIDATCAHVILTLLMRFNNQSRDNPLVGIRKTNDGMHATECWRRSYLVLMDSRPTIRLKQDQYEWLRLLLARKLPLGKEARERGEEAQDVGMHVFGLADDNVRQALTSLPDRRLPEAPDLVEAQPGETHENR